MATTYDHTDPETLTILQAISEKADALAPLDSINFLALVSRECSDRIAANTFTIVGPCHV